MRKDLRKKKNEQDNKGDVHEPAGNRDEKSSFGQCVFNMSNILMVSLISESRS